MTKLVIVAVAAALACVPSTASAKGGHGGGHHRHSSHRSHHRSHFTRLHKRTAGDDRGRHSGGIEDGVHHSSSNHAEIEHGILVPATPVAPYVPPTYAPVVTPPPSAAAPVAFVAPVAPPVPVQAPAANPGYAIVGHQ